MHRRAAQDPPAPAPREVAAGPGARGPASRRQVLRAAGALASLGVLGTGGLTAYRRLRPESDPRTVIPLWSATVAYAADGRRVLVGGRAQPRELEPGARLAAALPASAPARERAEAFREGTASWRDGLAARLEGSAQLQDLARTALQDLWVLGDALPAPVAGWSPSWQYIWPRDAAFCAAALARVGHLERAVTVLAHLQSLQAEDGWFEARYAPETGLPPDGRPRQFDGTGLLLWACAEVAEAADAAEAARAEDSAGAAGSAGAVRARDDVLERLSPLITRSLSALHTSTRGGTGLPPISPDYWEVRESSVTLGIMTATLTGLRAGAALTGTARAQQAVHSFTALFEGTFGRTGFQRYRGGGGADSALALLDATGFHGVIAPEQLLALRRELARPGGGIAPGASWRRDGVSWTPSTSLLGLALARAGEREAALEILGWLAAHRTTAGSLPEKVLFDGRSAEVAPLAWTAANVLLTLDALSRG